MHQHSATEREAERQAEAEMLQTKAREREQRNREMFLARVIHMIETARHKIETAVEDGKESISVRISDAVSHVGNTYQMSLENPEHPGHEVWNGLKEWADSQDLELTIVSEHDGVGVSSWLAIHANPKPTLLFKP